jgi:large subunit ribosomal protein L5
MNYLKDKYENELSKTLAQEFGICNRLAIPRVIKVVVNAGIGNLVKNKEALEVFKKDLMAITGQEPAFKKAKISVASFNLRRGMVAGMVVTLRGVRMYAFLERLFTIVLPRLRDFRGVSVKSFDLAGNYTLGIAEHTVFPEVDVTKGAPHGLEITIVTRARNKERSQRLLALLGLPFEKERQKERQKGDIPR